MESQLWPQLSAYADALDLTNTMHTSKTDYNLKGNAGHIASVLERFYNIIFYSESMTSVLYKAEDHQMSGCLQI